MKATEDKKNKAAGQEVVEINLVQLAKYIYTHRTFIFIGAVLAPALIGLWTFFVKKPVYKSQVSISVSAESATSDYEEKRLYYYFMEQDALNKVNWAEDFFHSKKFKDALLDEVEGRSSLIDSYDNMKSYKSNIIAYFFGAKKNMSYEARANTLTSFLKFSSNSDKNKIKIQASSPSPSVSMALSDVVSHLLMELNHKKLLAKVQHLIGFLDTQTQGLESDLKNLEGSLVKLQKKYGIISAEAVSYNVNTSSVKRSEERSLLRKKAVTNKRLLADIKKELELAKSKLSSGRKSSYMYLAQLEKRLELLKYQESLNRNGRSPSSEKDQHLRTRINSTLNNMQSVIADKKGDKLTVSSLSYVKDLEKYMLNLERERKELKSRINAHDGEEKQYESKLKSLPKALQSLSELSRNIKMTEKLYQEMKIRLQETRVREAGRANDMSILTRAEMPAKADGMGIVRKMILSSVTGIVLFILILLLRFVLIPTIRDVFDLEKYGMKVIGTIPWYKKARSGLLGVSQAPPLIIDIDPQSYEANSLYYAQFKLERELGLMKSSASTKKSGKIVGFCSVNSSEGKTFCSTNLAYSLARSQYKVLLIDTDFSKPDIMDYFVSEEVERGLRSIEYANQEISFRAKRVNSHLEVMLAPVGQDFFSDILQSTSFRDLINEMKEDYDIIIMDTPPMNGHMSSLLVSQYADTLVMVVNQRATLSQDVYKHYKNLAENIDYPILGILNFVYDDIKSHRRANESKKVS